MARRLGGAVRNRGRRAGRLLLVAGGLVVQPALPAVAGDVEAAAPPIRVLLLTGANNHDWPATTTPLQQILDDTGRFDVDVIENTRTLTAERLAGADVILSNFNTFTTRDRQPRDPGWSAATRRAYTAFVRDGGGHVVVHAGSSSFYDWPAYQELVITSFRVGQTDHGVRHAFPVRIDAPDHPITRGLCPFETFDELWHDAPVQAGATVLASAFSSEASRGSGRHEPVALVRRYGKGRSFTLLLGHDARAMENAGFRTLLARGTEWAATGAVTLVPPAEGPGTTSSRRWARDADAVALLDGDHVVWRFHHGPDAGKPHFHPLALPGRPPLTSRNPPDHPWHHGLWFSWKLIDGVNFWEEDRATGRSDGRTEWSDVTVTTGADHAARIELNVVYRPDDGPPALRERRRVDVSPPEDDGGYHLDWTSAFNADRAIRLDRVPPPGEPGGQVSGGYAGLALRLAPDLDERRVVSTDGPVSFEGDRHRSRPRAVDYSGVGGGAPMGVAIVDHPGNVNTPSPWYVIRSREMSYFGPAVLGEGPLALAAGERLTLRYRVLVHGDRWTADRLDAEYARFVRETRDQEEDRP